MPRSRMARGCRAPHPRSLVRLAHRVGLPHSQKGGSHEGSGLSVSLHPQAWRAIAGLPGSLFLLHKEGGAFVDVHACLANRHLMRQVWEWNAGAGYIERGMIYRVDFYDDEVQIRRLLPFLDARQAREEYAFLKDDREGVALRAYWGYIPTERMQERALHNSPPLAFVADFALSFLVEDLFPALDGLWWANELDPAALPAPRGAIFLSRLASWEHTLVGEGERGRGEDAR